MRQLRVLALVNENLVPPDSMEGKSEREIDEWKTEFDVITTLKELGHQVEVLGLSDDLSPIRNAIHKSKPHIAFNLLEEFHGVVTYDHAIVSYLELMRQPYTGCNPRGLMISKDKALTKKILSYHRIPSPRFAVFPVGRKVVRPKKLPFPIFVKSVIDDASLGISQASVVYDDRELAERVAFVHEHTMADALAEEFIEGRELYVGVIGNDRLQTFPVWELLFTKSDIPLIATRKVKWDRNYQEKLGVVTDLAQNLEPQVEKQIGRICKKVYNSLDMSGYARMDLRMRPDGRVYVLEANANPNLAFGEDFAESAEKSQLTYEDLLTKIVALGMRYRAPWKI
ncbi:D-alanine--D-alanine ligase family protein [Aureliella helgolandensis]|uniref:Ddl-like protein n=1 Tax=Aureliella helgolandensis TaxID=2527968 RepID=A0A518GES5_9BACT|nr:D-alanine--D-alanine ligase [Aureliella helgolandensis]QDV27093.1 Ddl-like protein [Aureliella helgolandensis]